LNVSLLYFFIPFFNYSLPAADCKCSLLIKSKKTLERRRKRTKKKEELSLSSLHYAGVGIKEEKKIYMYEPISPFFFQSCA
jgi:hypothetical protein